MKFCALIFRGQVVEVVPVLDSHSFGAHGNHWHLQVKTAAVHMCSNDPFLGVVDVEEDESGKSTYDLHGEGV
jgi:hypothetical protein